MNIIPGFSSVERHFKVPLFFTVIILYQGLISGGAFETPAFFKKHMKDPNVRFISLLLIALSATKDIEVSIIGLAVFLFILNMVRTEEEKEKLGTFLGIFKGVV